MGGVATGLSKLPKKDNKKAKKIGTLSSVGAQGSKPSAGVGGLGKAIGKVVKNKKPGQVLGNFIRGK